MIAVPCTDMFIRLRARNRHRPHAVLVVAANGRPSRSEIPITEEEDQSLGRSQRRSLRRIYNGRKAPILVDGTPFLTYKEAVRFLLSLTPDSRERAFAQMRSGAAGGSGIQPSLAPTYKE